jgi:hypothetical protein
MPPGALGLYRIAYAALVLLVLGVPPFRWISQKPDIFFNPPIYSIANLFDGFPPTYFFVGLEATVVVSLTFLLFGFKTRWASWLLALGLFTGFGWSYAYGKINHDTLLMALVPLVMGFSNWGAHFSIDQRQGAAPERERAWPVAVLALLLGFAMFTAGVPKLLSGWLDLTTQAVHGHTIRQHYDFYADQLLTPRLMSFDQPVFWEILDYSAVLFEIGFLLAVFRLPVFRLFVTLAVLFHLANCFMLNIDFSRNIAFYLLFIHWSPLLKRFRHSWPSVQPLVRVRFLIVGSIFFLVYYLLEVPPVFRAITLLLGWDNLASGALLVALAVIFFSVNYLNSLATRSAANNLPQQ